MSSTIRFAAMALWLVVTLPAQGYELQRLMAAPDYPRDQQLAADLNATLHLYFPSVQNPVISSASYREPYAVADLMRVSTLWNSHIRAACKRLHERYRTVVLAGNHNDDGYLNVLEQFRNSFADGVFGECEQYETMIQQYLQAKREMQHELPKRLQLYRESADQIVPFSKVSTVKALSDQSSARYEQRLSNRVILQVLLQWMRDYQPNHPQLPAWEREYREVTAAFAQAASEYAQQLLPKSQLPSDLHADDQPEQVAAANALRDRIATLFSAQFGHSPQQILLGDNVLRDVKRLLLTEGKLQAEDYRAINFVAVLPAGSGLVSTHRGWYEQVAGAEAQLVLLEGEANVGEARPDQLVRAGDAPDTNRAEAEAVAAQHAQELAAREQRTAAEVADYQAQAQAEVAAQLAAAQALQDEYRSDVDGSGMSLRAVANGLLMVLAALLLLRPSLGNKMPAAITPALDALSAVRTPLAVLLAALGLIALVTSLLAFHLLGIVTGLLALVSALLLVAETLMQMPASEGGRAGRIAQFKPWIATAQAYQQAIACAVLVVGLLMIVGLI
jgi:hypothetical protein